jgi:hypothetical protein
LMGLAYRLQLCGNFRGLIKVFLPNSRRAGTGRRVSLAREEKDSSGADESAHHLRLEQDGPPARHEGGPLIGQALRLRGKQVHVPGLQPQRIRRRAHGLGRRAGPKPYGLPSQSKKLSLWPALPE